MADINSVLYDSAKELAVETIKRVVNHNNIKDITKDNVFALIDVISFVSVSVEFRILLKLESKEIYKQCMNAFYENIIFEVSNLSLDGTTYQRNRDIIQNRCLYWRRRMKENPDNAFDELQLMIYHSIAYNGVDEWKGDEPLIVQDIFDDYLHKSALIGFIKDMSDELSRLEKDFNNNRNTLKDNNPHPVRNFIIRSLVFVFGHFIVEFLKLLIWKGNTQGALITWIIVGLEIYLFFKLIPNGIISALDKRSKKRNVSKPIKTPSINDRSCQTCGFEFPEGDLPNFCSKCGSKVQSRNKKGNDDSKDTALSVILLVGILVGFSLIGIIVAILG